MATVSTQILCFVLLFASISAVRSFMPEFIKGFFSKPAEPQGSRMYENPPFNETFAKQMAYASALGYCGIEDVMTWKCGAPCNMLSGYTQYFMHQSYENKDVAYMILISHSEKQVVFTFRGTNSHQQLISQATHSRASNYSTEFWNSTHAQVLTYFRNIYKNMLQKSVLENLEGLGTSNYSHYTFVFTGHSLGGALATLAALDASTSKKIPVTPGSSPYLITYGSPRVGNYYFSKSVDNLIPVMFRVTNANDLVPHVPPCSGSMIVTSCKVPSVQDPELERKEHAFWYGWHIRQEIWYKNSTASFVVCSPSMNEDPLCSNSLYLSSVDAHYNYLDLPISRMCNKYQR